MARIEVQVQLSKKLPAHLLDFHPVPHPAAGGPQPSPALAVLGSLVSAEHSNGLPP